MENVYFFLFLLSALLIPVSLIIPVKIPFITKKRARKNSVFFFWIAVLFLVLFGIVASPYKPNNEGVIDYKLATPPAETVADTTIGEQVKQNKINISRAQIQNQFEEKGYLFSKEDPIDGEENYIGVKNAGEIQLLGDGNNLSSASFTTQLYTSIDGTVEESALAQSEMMLFGSLFFNEESCRNWYVGQLETMHADIDKVYKSSANVCGRKVVIYYFPGDSMTLGFLPEE